MIYVVISYTLTYTYIRMSYEITVDFQHGIVQ